MVLAGHLFVLAILTNGLTDKSVSSRDFISYWAAGKQLHHGGNPYDFAAVRSLERTIDEQLLPALELLDDDDTSPSPEYGVAWRWATGWLAAQQRIAPPATRPNLRTLESAGPVH